MTNLETKIAIGTAKASIQAKLRNTYSKISDISKPFPKNLSRLLNRKLVRSINKRTTIAIINGNRCSFNIYLVRIFNFLNDL